MKNTLPLLFGCAVGLFVIVEFFVPHYALASVATELLSWATVVAACAYIAGGFNLLQVTWPKIRRREPEWQYKVVLLAAAFITAIAGLPFPSARDASRVELTGNDATLAATGQARIAVEAPSDIAVVIDGVAHPARDARGAAAQLYVPAGPHHIVARHAAGGYHEFSVELTLPAGALAHLTADPPLQWGADGRVRTWIYTHVFAPCNSTMFALLAFFVASAAFRAFRARNVESALLLGSAIIVLLALAPIGRALHSSLPDLANWILDIPNNGSRRAILMGAAVGAIATGLRVVLGLERAHLGGDA